MELKLDLHIQSEYSPDGSMPLKDIVARAKAVGLRGVAICDHDAVMRDVPEFEDFIVIPGIEISTEYGHLLGLFVTEPINDKHFFPAVDAIHKAGGLAVLAHPFEHSTDSGRIAPIVQFIDGIEVWNGRAERNIRNANSLAETFAAEHDLRRFASSDAHVPGEIGNGVTTIDVPEMTLSAVKSALLSGSVSTSGKRGKAIHAALSQLNKRKKTGAKMPAYAKWLLFAAKCLAQDLFRKGD